MAALLNRRNTPQRSTVSGTCSQYYQTTRHAEEALYRWSRLTGLGSPTRPETAAAVLAGTTSPTVSGTGRLALLKGKGLSPEENSSSSISKIYRTVVPS